jgi:hypothetical protein
MSEIEFGVMRACRIYAAVEGIPEFEEYELPIVIALTDGNVVVPE